jgi:Tfp pilus assembly protein FimT
MVIVLSIIAVVVSVAILDFTNVETEQRLRESVGRVESLAKRARNIAVVQQRAYQLRITQESISIAPQYTREFEDDGDEIERRNRFEDVTDSEQTDSGVTYEVRRWASDEWQIIEKDKDVVLTIEPTGLVEPISIRCSVGNSWIMQELHPLTASIRYEEMNIEKE